MVLLMIIERGKQDTVLSLVRSTMNLMQTNW